MQIKDKHRRTVFVHNIEQVYTYIIVRHSLNFLNFVVLFCSMILSSGTNCLRGHDLLTRIQDKSRAVAGKPREAV